MSGETPKPASLESGLLNRRLSTALGWCALGSLGVLAVLGLWVAPPDAVQRDAQRLMYLHVPAAWLAYLSFAVTALGSALYLWRRTRSAVWDRIAGASAEIGVVFTGLTLVLGSLWGRPVWGIWWAWDARLVSTAVLFFLYVGYLALRRIPGPGRASRCAIAALIAFVDVPIVHFSVDWWRTLHQEGTVFNEELKANIRGTMAFTLFWGVLAFTLVYVYLLDRRYRLETLEEGREERELEQAIAERVASGGPGSAGGQGELVDSGAPR
jgi:heme exporter protein C